MPTLTRSPAPADLSPEVAWYLAERGIVYPDCPPRIKTPEPRGRGVRFDPERVDHVRRVFSMLRHTQGKWAGLPLIPDPWQVAYILAPIFGWVRRNDDGDWVRVIRRAWIEVPRKNGKTTTAGGIAVTLTTADHEPGAQVYAIAAARDQARYCFDPVKQLAEQSPALRQYVKPTRSRIVHMPSGSYFAVASKAADLLYGANVHGAIVDELHIHKSAELVENVESGTGSRRQPLVVIITTADDGRQDTIYARRRGYVEKVASGALRDDAWYGVIWAADERDDPFDESTWKAANPGYGISPSREYLRQKANEAQNSPAELAAFLRLHLGIRTRQQSKYIDLRVWDRNASIVDETALAGKECYGGLDLAATSDLTAVAWDFPDGHGGHDVLWRLWVPQPAFERLNVRTSGQADVWRRNGLLTVLDGEVTDYGFIRRQINADRQRFDVREIGFDRWNSSQLVNDLMSDEAPMVQVGQGYASMSAPTKELLRTLLSGTVTAPMYRHGGNACLRWQVDNLAVEMDPAGNVKPSKRKAGDKIDGLVAGIIALSRAMAAQPGRLSAYETNSLEVV